MCGACQEAGDQEGAGEKGREKVNSIYTHLELGQDVRFPAGYYTPLVEMRLTYKGREVVYVVGQATAESCCCASGSCGYVVVPGYVVSWKNRTSESGRLLSDIEPVIDEEARLEVAGIIRQREGISNIKFW